MVIIGNLVVQLPECKILFDGGIKSQSVDAVKAMIEFFDGEPCQKLPALVQLANGWQLTLSSKRDCYYVTSRDNCSCLGFHYKHSCKHVQALARDQEIKEHVIDLHDTKPGEVRYWEQKQEKALEPVEDARLKAAHNLRDNIIAAQEA